MRTPPSPRIRRQLGAAALLGLTVVVAFLWLRGRPLPPTLDKAAAEIAATKTPRSGRLESVRVSADPAARPAVEWREAPTRSGVDASNIYKNAFVLFDRLSDEEKKMIRQPREEVDAEKAAALFEKIRAIMELLREAARADYCDWGMAPYTFDTPLPQISKSMDLGKLALWAAAYEFPSDPATAINDLAARATLGHHVADTRIGLLVETAFEKGAHNLLGQNLGALDASMAAKVNALMQSSMIDEDLTRAFEAESVGSEALAKQLAKMNPEERARMLQGFDETKPGTPERAAVEEAMKTYSDPPRLEQELAFVRAKLEAIPAAMKLSNAEFASWWAGVQREISDHPIAQVTLPAVVAVQSGIQQTRVERALFSAGLDVLQNGPAQLARYRDPSTGQAFTYVPTPAGFELRSTLQVKGKPVTFSFPQPK